MNNPLIVKSAPAAVAPFLRFQIGRMEPRASRVPQYGRSSGKKVLSHAVGPQQNYFRLIGFGETETAAKRMTVQAMGIASLEILETLLNPATDQAH